MSKVTKTGEANITDQELAEIEAALSEASEATAEEQTEVEAATQQEETTGEPEASAEATAEEAPKKKGGKKRKKTEAKSEQGDVTEAKSEQSDETEVTEASGDETVEAKDDATEEAKPSRLPAGSPKSLVLASKLEGIDNAHEYFAFTMAEAELGDRALKNRQQKFLARVDEMKKKIGEKAVNLIQSVAGKGTLSVYTEIAFKALEAAEDNKMTSKQLVDTYLATQKPNSSGTYEMGTARAQANQMFQLFPELGIATREKNVLTLNPDSVLAARLRHMLDDTGAEEQQEAA